jgi:hypothetical protein
VWYHSGDCWAPRSKADPFPFWRSKGIESSGVEAFYYCGCECPGEDVSQGGESHSSMSAREGGSESVRREDVLVCPLSGDS